MLATLLDLVFPPRQSERLTRATSLSDVETIFDPRLSDSTTPKSHVLLPFSDARVRALIHESKYHDNAQAQARLGSILTTYLKEVGREHVLLHTNTYVLVPMPLHPKKKRSRGYNQMERILDHARALEVPTKQVLSRTKYTDTQTKLSVQQRKENVRDAFVATDIRSKCTYVLVDDVLTTGSTMQAAIDTLYEAGAEDVIPIALAH